MASTTFIAHFESSPSSFICSCVQWQHIAHRIRISLKFPKRISANNVLQGFAVFFGILMDNESIENQCLVFCSSCLEFAHPPWYSKWQNLCSSAFRQSAKPSQSSLTKIFKFLPHFASNSKRAKCKGSFAVNKVYIQGLLHPRRVSGTCFVSLEFMRSNISMHFIK